MEVVSARWQTGGSGGVVNSKENVLGFRTAVADRVRRSSAERSFLASAELGISPGDLEQASSIVAGYEREAGIQRRDGLTNTESFSVTQSVAE